MAVIAIGHIEAVSSAFSAGLYGSGAILSIVMWASAVSVSMSIITTVVVHGAVMSTVIVTMFDWCEMTLRVPAGMVFTRLCIIYSVTGEC